jgi:hypothetical protein
VRRWKAWLFWLPALMAGGDWLALKTGALSHPPWVLAGLVVATAPALIGRVCSLTLDLKRRRCEWSSGSAQIVLLSGVLVALGGGTLNWVLGLQGFVVLHEGEPVPLYGDGHLQELEKGPLGSMEDMNLVMMLEELELVPAGADSFYPVSRLRVERESAPSSKMEVSSRRVGICGNLRFYQGAFGYAPRIVITKGKETVFDEVVPFTTERRGPGGVSFLGHFELGDEGLDVHGEVNLPEELRGHATLSLAMTRMGEPLGRGSLLPGHFADISDDYRVGFAGLRKWSEIDIARRCYEPVVAGGAGMALLGLVFWPVARWRGRLTTIR